MIAIGIAGAAGKMGRALVRAVTSRPELQLALAWEKPGHELLGQDSGLLAGVPANRIMIQSLKPGDLKKCQVLLDFTAPEATLGLLAQAQAEKASLVIGTTGLNDSQLGKLREAAKNLALVYATNFSLGMNLLWNLARRTAACLGEAYDAEIIESHHNQKKDAPSGTALTLLEAICQGKGLDPQQAMKPGRAGLLGPRPKAEVGVHAVRAGDIVGDHIALFSGPGERLELKHQLHSRDTLAQGAVRAAGWVAGQAPGFYTMAQVLGLD